MLTLLSQLAPVNKNNLLRCVTCSYSDTAALVWHKLGLVLTISFTKTLASRLGTMISLAGQRLNIAYQGLNVETFGQFFFFKKWPWLTSI